MDPRCQSSGACVPAKRLGEVPEVISAGVELFGVEGSGFIVGWRNGSKADFDISDCLMKRDRPILRRRVDR